MLWPCYSLKHFYSLTLQKFCLHFSFLIFCSPLISTIMKCLRLWIMGFDLSSSFISSLIWGLGPQPWKVEPWNSRSSLPHGLWSWVGHQTPLGFRFLWREALVKHQREGVKNQWFIYKVSFHSHMHRVMLLKSLHFWKKHFFSILCCDSVPL